jgi:hypothetical protein
MFAISTGVDVHHRSITSASANRRPPGDRACRRVRPPDIDIPARRIPHVVGTLWDIDDYAATPIARVLWTVAHRRRRLRPRQGRRSAPPHWKPTARRGAACTIPPGRPPPRWRLILQRMKELGCIQDKPGPRRRTARKDAGMTVARDAVRRDVLLALLLAAVQCRDLPDLPGPEPRPEQDLPADTRAAADSTASATADRRSPYLNVGPGQVRRPEALVPPVVPNGLFSFFEFSPLTWSPLTESNRRPSPYHGHGRPPRVPCLHR